MASATSVSVPCARQPFGVQSLARARTERSRASGATPATPVPLPVLAAAMPATWVPWPASSAPTPSTHPPVAPSWPTQSTSPSTLPTRSGCAADDARVDDGDGDAGASRRRSTPPGRRCASRPHCRLAPGSLGAVWAPTAPVDASTPKVVTPKARATTPRSGRTEGTAPLSLLQPANGQREPNGHRLGWRSAPSAAAEGGQRRRRTVTTRPKTVTSSGSNSIGASRAFAGCRTTLAPRRA